MANLKHHLDLLFEECKHGYEQHQTWLKDKFNDYLNKATDWIELSKEPPPPLTVVLGYNEKWIDDYEPEGIREAFMQDDGDWLSAKWNNSMDTWITDDETKPTHWMQRPKSPKVKRRN